MIYKIIYILCLYSDRVNLREIANRMVRLAYGDPKDFTFQYVKLILYFFHLVGGKMDGIVESRQGLNTNIYTFIIYSDALQMIFSMHCCLHLIGQAISVGRLDQLLITFYNKDIANGTLRSKEEVFDFASTTIN